MHFFLANSSYICNLSSWFSFCTAWASMPLPLHSEQPMATANGHGPKVNVQALPLHVQLLPINPHRYTLQPTASPPCASDGRYPKRLDLRGGWACSMVHSASALHSARAGPPSGAGWSGSDHGWSGHGDSLHCSTWRGRSRPRRSPDPALVPGGGWSGDDIGLKSGGTGLGWLGLGMGRNPFGLLLQIRNLLCSYCCRSLCWILLLHLSSPPLMGRMMLALAALKDGDKERGLLKNSSHQLGPDCITL